MSQQYPAGIRNVPSRTHAHMHTCTHAHACNILPPPPVSGLSGDYAQEHHREKGGYPLHHSRHIAVYTSTSTLHPVWYPSNTLPTPFHHPGPPPSHTTIPHQAGESGGITRDAAVLINDCGVITDIVDWHGAEDGDVTAWDA